MGAAFKENLVKPDYKKLEKFEEARNKVLERAPQFNVTAESHALTKLLGIMYKQGKDLQHIDAVNTLKEVYTANTKERMDCVRANEVVHRDGCCACNEVVHAHRDGFCACNEVVHRLQAKWILERYCEQQLTAALDGTIFDALGTITGSFASITYDFGKDTILNTEIYEKLAHDAAE